MQDSTGKLLTAMCRFSAIVKALYAHKAFTELDIQRRHVEIGGLSRSTAAIATEAAVVDGVTYYAGLFVYKGKLLRGTARHQFEVIDPALLSPVTQRKLLAQLRAKANKFVKRLEVAAHAA